MNIKIITSQCGIDALMKSERECERLGIKNTLCCLPERTFRHPKHISESTEQLLENRKLEGCKTLEIYTYSEHVFNRVRIFCKRNQCEARVHVFMNDDSEKDITILPDGRLSEWVPEVFDQWDNEIDELI